MPLTAFCCAAVLLGQSSPLDSINPFMGKWTGEFTGQGVKMQIDLEWTRFGNHWAEAKYTYTAGKAKLEYRVLLAPDAEGKTLKVWSFGPDAKTPETMVGTVESGILRVVSDRKGSPVIVFKLGDDGKLVMTAESATPDPKVMATATMTKSGG